MNTNPCMLAVLPRRVHECFWVRSEQYEWYIALIQENRTCRWHNRKDWAALIRNGMTSDLSWDRAAKDYEQIFNWALMDPPQA